MNFGPDFRTLGVFIRKLSPTVQRILHGSEGARQVANRGLSTKVPGEEIEEAGSSLWFSGRGTVTPESIALFL